MVSTIWCYQYSISSFFPSAVSHPPLHSTEDTLFFLHMEPYKIEDTLSQRSQAKNST